jgi:hypothetical protein
MLYAWVRGLWNTKLFTKIIVYVTSEDSAIAIVSVVQDWSGCVCLHPMVFYLCQTSAIITVCLKQLFNPFPLDLFSPITLGRLLSS